ncbi:MAG: phosphohistidine-like domain-containing protein [Desulfurivibrionaceae bacterium]
MDITDLKSNMVSLADEIIQAETGQNSWTLMHRFNLCHDFLDRVLNTDDLALLFVWLRFSALRQLDWQRNYNTKPRELTHAQQRLTLKLASLYQHQAPEGRAIIRLIFSTLGRGAEGHRGQQIRDDILHIMHRHNLKEVSGHFLEEWHQKLHNNTTADDIVICEAYLEFLRTNGDLDRFYNTLEQGGVSRERLRSFERPIVTDPDFVPHIKDNLIHDFENYLDLLRTIHSAMDLASAINEAGHCLDEELEHKAARIYQDRNNEEIPLTDRVRAVTDLRISLQDALNRTTADDCRRDILYLDLALEEFLRLTVEGNTHKHLPPEFLEDLIGMLGENVRLYHHNPELVNCLDLLHALKSREAASPEDRALQFIAVNEKINNVLASFADYYTDLLQEKAEYLGRGFKADRWVIDLFSQEIIRSGAAFILSILLNLNDRALRKTANLRSWQIISRGRARGILRVENLMDLQNTELNEPTVVLSDRLSGEEEIINNLTGVITSSSVDMLSHIAVRARNAGILFASCYEKGIIDTLEELEGQPVFLSPAASGDVLFEKAATLDTEHKAMPATPNVLTRRAEKIEGFSLPSAPYDKAGVEYPLAVDMGSFDPEITGGKAYQLKRLKEKLPGWIGIPASAAIPFGVCEKVLALEENRNLQTEYDQLLREVDQNPAKVLPRLRDLVTELTLPPALLNDLREAMEEQDLVFPADLDTFKKRIKQIWASKWNDRAYYSRKKWEINHRDLVMSVLIQQVVPAEYAFVLHTVNPFTGQDDEIYGEIVVGLGETLCSGNYQGKALSFVCKKSKDAQPELQFYPSKSQALFGSGLILRSDSNGEDLQNYAGAGLYDSHTLEPPREEIIDYNKVDLLWQGKLRDDFLRKLTEIGLEVEKAMEGAAQDIEGVYADGRFYVVQTRSQVGADWKGHRTTDQELEPAQKKFPFRIGNQTSYSAIRASAPFDFAVNNGFDAFEWFPDKKGDGSGWDTDELSSRQIDWIRKTASDNGIFLSVHAPWWANPLKEGGTALILKHIHFAVAIEARLLVIHFYTGQGTGLFLEKLKPVILATHKAGLKLALENTPETTPEDCNTFFSLLKETEMPGKHVGLCFDLGHANLCRTTPNDYVGFLQNLSSHVPLIHVHFHENYGETDTHLPLFTGPSKNNPAGLELVIKHLRERNFKGAIILEQWPDPPSLLIKARNRLLDLY